MNAPHRYRTLHDIRRPWQAWSDPRMALGAAIREPHWPDAACVHCWPALIQATHYDPTGKPCCPLCAGNANRRLS